MGIGNLGKLGRLGKRVRVAKRAAGRGARSLGRNKFVRAAGEIGLSAIVGAFGQNLQSIRAQQAEQKAKREEASGGAGAGTGGGASLPGTDTPDAANRVANPTLASLIDQVDQLVAIAGRISDNLKSQQEYFVNQNAQAVRVNKESQLEKAPDALAEPTASSETDIGPVSSALDGFAEALTALTEAIQNSAAGGGGVGPDLGDMSRRRGGRGSRGGSNVRREATRAGGTRYRDATTGRFISRADAEAANLAKKPGMLRRGLGAVTGSKAVRTLGGAIKGAGQAAGKSAVGTSIKATVKKLAGPIIAKGIGKTALKSIPLVGAAVGGLFAIGRLLQGDTVGAGIEAASGLAGPITAIPLFLASVARDIYQGVYGVQPEADPEFASRFPEVQSAVKEVAAEVMAPQVEKKGTATGSPAAAQAAMTPKAMPKVETGGGNAPPTPTTPPASPESAPPYSGTPPAATSAASSTGSSTASSKDTSATPPPISSSSGSPSATGGSGGDRPTIAPKEPDSNVPGPAALMPPKSDTGASIASATAAATPSEPSSNMSSSPSRVQSPSRDLTTRPGYTGQGNVPDPTYTNAGDMMPQLLFFG